MDNNLKRTIIMEHYQNPKNKGLIEDSSYGFVNMNNESCIETVRHVRYVQVRHLL